MKKFFGLLAIATTLLACNNNNPDQPIDNDNTNPAAPLINYTVIKEHPHDTSFFTEGLEFYKGQLFESSGGNNDGTNHPSAFGVVDRATGKVAIKASLDRAKYFGEGITIFNNKIYQLTWTGEKGFVYDASSFKLLKEFSYKGQGWGLTHDSSRLIMSDGSSNIKFLDPETLQVLNIMGVSDNNGPVGNLNELALAGGYLYANQWQSNLIYKIEMPSGKVVGRIDLDNLARQAQQRFSGANELNGIAYNEETGSFLITGKNWPVFFELKLN